VYGLVPVPIMPASCTYQQSCDRRSTTRGNVDTAPVNGIPNNITGRMARRDEITRIRARFLTRLRVPS
jgi:hypothetical protein